MIHYHVWFNLKAGVVEAEGLAIVQRYLTALCSIEEAAGFQLLRNKGTAPRSQLPRYHALVEFSDEAQLAAAMKQQAARGIHVGLHGDVVNVVTEFHVEIFSAVDTSALANANDA